MAKKVQNKKPQNKKNQAETIPETFANFYKWLVRVLVTAYTVLIICVLPFYNEEGFTHIGTDKSTFFKGCSVFMGKLLLPVLLVWLIFWVAVAIGKKRAGKAWKPQLGMELPDWFALSFAISVILSYLCTDYRQTALWGTKGWFMGMIPLLTFMSIYFLVSRLEMGAKWVLYSCLPVSAVVFVLGYLNRFDIWPLRMENSGLPNYISTVGNINWYCGYVVSVLFVGVGLLWLDKGEKKWYTVLLSVYTCIGFATLVTQGSDSGLFAFAAVALAMFVMSSKTQDQLKMKRFWQVIGLFAMACFLTWCIRMLFPEQINQSGALVDLLTDTPVSLVIAAVSLAGWWLSGRENTVHIWKIAAKGFCIAVPVVIVGLIVMIAVNTANPGSLGSLSDKSVFTFNNKWGSNRGATWRLGVECFGEQDVLHKLVGVGPDCMADYLYKGSSEELLADVKSAFENKRLTNAHNEILTLLVNVGLCGAVTYAGLLLAMLGRLLKAFEKNRYATACGLCLLAYIANNLWSFQQSLSGATIFVMMGLGAYFLRSDAAKARNAN